MSGPQPSFHPSPRKPKLRLPEGACDAHVHVFGPSRVFPYAKDAPFVPADAPKESLFAMHALLGIARCAIVQSTCHGWDNAVVADAIAAKRGAYCGIALAPPYRDAIAFAARLVAEFGDRTLWGTDWPHPNLNHVPDDGLLADLLAQIAPSEALRQALLVDNPQRLYRFPVIRP